MKKDKYIPRIIDTIIKEYLDDLYRYIKQFHNGILLKINEKMQIKILTTNRYPKIEKTLIL